MKTANKINIVFFGTHQFAAVILKGLIDSPFITVDLVITQPDKPAGRKQEIQKSPVKILAEQYNLQTDQPDTLKNYQLATGKFDLAIVAQYGLLIPESILNTPKFGAINVHTSLLPKYRGASPIQSALINGETETGVTIMQMDKGLDTGPIFSQKNIAISEDDNYPTLEEKMSKISVPLLLETVHAYIAGEIKPYAQDNNLATLTKQLNRDSGKINWKETSSEIYNLYRGLYPWPGIWTELAGKRLKLLQIKIDEKNLPAGQILVENNRIFIGCTKGSIEVLELQLEGKKVLDAKTFLNGNKINNLNLL